jgi:hypothetical protein
MRSVIAKAGLLAAVLVVCGGGSARAATMEIKVPFPFLVHGKMLPAGEYQVDNDGNVVRLLGEKGNRAAIFVMATPATGHDPMGSTPTLTFVKDEAAQYRLIDIWESSSEGFEIRR